MSSLAWINPPTANVTKQRITQGKLNENTKEINEPQHF